jgi:hypothetical protein
MGMKRFAAVALLVAGCAVPVWAQRGGGRPVSGFGGGARSSFGSARSSFAPSGRYSLGSAPTLKRTSSIGATPAFRSGVGNGVRRPGYPAGVYRRPYVPAYGAGWIAQAAFGYTGPGFYYGPGYYDDPGYSDPGPQAAYAPPYDLPPDQSAMLGPGAGDTYRPVYAAAALPPEPLSADAVTLVFKDGRPTEQIHNYLLTRTTLYVQDAQRRNIPVDEIDLVATAKANRAAGVEFALPDGAK